MDGAAHPGLAPETGSIDEMVNGSGGVRPHWRGLLGVLSGFDAQELNERARRLHLAAEDETASHAWRCDPVPLPLPAEEFAALERGLVQRARLLEALLADIYGPQAMLAEGVVPPALIHANPGYLRACRTDPPPLAPRYLHTYTADLLRGADGAWRVLADRTGGAQSIGYARESRRLLALVLPELFRTAQVRQLRPFFEAWQDALLRKAVGADGRPPVVAMLTPGPSDPHWPEHLALSRDLACALVEARDLTVRAGVLSIKTLAGLQPVDILFRRVPGTGIDPLELARLGGVAGLLDAARQGSVLIVNHPGTAVVEAGGFADLLPALAQRFLGEALLLASVPDAARAEPSRAPCVGPAGLGAEPVVLRMFLMHDGAPGHVGAWHVMQGGLARVLPNVLPLGEAVAEMPPPGSVFKDVWVLNQDTSMIQGPAPVRQPPAHVRRSAGNLPSRVADDFFWFGRYVDRLEAQARLARAGLFRRGRGAPLPRELAELAVLDRCLLASGYDAAEAGAPFEHQVRRALQPNGVIGTGLDQATRLIEALRDRMTVETHGAFIHALRAARTDLVGTDEAGIDGLLHAMAGLQRLATTIAGVASEDMVHGGGRLFLDLGRRVERAQVGAAVLAAVLEQPPVRIDGTLRMALELCDSAITYRSRYLTALQPAPVLDLVLADPGNPRALASQFAQAAALLTSAGDAELAEFAAKQQAAIEALVHRVAEATDPAAETSAAAAAVRELGHAAAELSERVTRRYFALLPLVQTVGLEMA